MDKNVEKLREALCKAERRLKAAGIEYAPKAGDFASDRSKAVTVMSEEYRHAVEECFGDTCDDVLGGYDISDEMMGGKHGKELIDDICDHVGTEYFADKAADARRKGKEPVEEGRNNVELNRILPTVAFIDIADADSYADSAEGYPDTEEFADADGYVDYEAYDDAVDAFVSSKKAELSDLYGLGIVYDREHLDNAIYDFNQETLRQAADLWKVGDEQGQADSEALKGLMLDVEANYDIGSRIVCRNEQDFQILSAPVREAQIKRFSDYLRSLCDHFGPIEWDKSKNYYAFGSPKEAGIPEAKGLSEGYSGQTVEDFFDDCGDTSAIDRVIVYAYGDEEPVYDGGYYDLPESILEAPFLEFGTDRLTVNVADEGGSAYYDTLEDFLDDANVDDVQVWDSDSEDVAYDGDKDSIDDELRQKPFLSFDAPEYISINLDCDKSELDLGELEEAKGKKKKGIRARTNVGDPKKNMAFFNMAMGASEYAGKGDGCCAGEGAEAEGGIGESKECGKTIAKTFKGKDKKKVDEMTDDELSRMPEGDEKRCIGMLNSMIAYDWDRKETAKEFLDRIEGTHTYEYIKEYVEEFGIDKVAELMQRQIDDIDRIAYAGTDSEGVSYNSIIWKDSKRESLKPRRLAEGESAKKPKYAVYYTSAPKGFDGLVAEYLSFADSPAEAKAEAKRFIGRGYRILGVLSVEELKDGKALGGLEFSKANEGTEKLKDGKWANVGKDGKADSGTFKTKKEADAQRRAMFANGHKAESLDGNVIYEFPADEITEEDLNAMREYGLIPLGKSGKGRGEENFAVFGQEENLRDYCDNWIGGYEPAKEYLADPEYFVADFYDEADLDKYDEVVFGIGECVSPDSSDSKSDNKNESASKETKLDSEGIQYFGTKNQFNYDKQQLRIDHDAKTYEKGMFTHIARRETVSTPELRRIIKRLDDMGYKEVKHGDTKVPEGYFEAWKSHSKAKYFEAWERHSAEKALDKSRSECHDIHGKKENVMDNGNKAVEESESKGGLAKKIIDFANKNIPEAELTDEVIDDWDIDVSDKDKAHMQKAEKGKPSDESVKSEGVQAGKESLRPFYEFLYDCLDEYMRFVFEDRPDVFEDALKYYGFSGDLLQDKLDNADEDEIREFIVNYMVDTAPEDYDGNLESLKSVIDADDDPDYYAQGLSLLDKAFGNRKDEVGESEDGDGQCICESEYGQRFVIRDKAEYAREYADAVEATRKKSQGWQDKVMGMYSKYARPTPLTPDQVLEY